MGQNIDSDRARLARVQAGETGAIDALYRAHRDVAHGVAYRVLRDNALAEDAVQEGFLDLWRTAARFDPARSSVRAWLCVLVHRRAVDIVRREVRRHADDSERPEPDPASYTAEELAVRRYERWRVRHALANLSPDQRVLIALAYWGGLTQSQLADRLEVPLGTVKSRMFEALRHLRVTLATAA